MNREDAYLKTVDLTTFVGDSWSERLLSFTRRVESFNVRCKQSTSFTGDAWTANQILDYITKTLCPTKVHARELQRQWMTKSQYLPCQQWGQNEFSIVFTDAETLVGFTIEQQKESTSVGIRNRITAVSGSEVNLR